MSTSDSLVTAPPGWLPRLAEPGVEAWWTGTQWSGHTRSIAAPSSPAFSEQASTSIDTEARRPAPEQTQASLNIVPTKVASDSRPRAKFWIAIAVISLVVLGVTYLQSLGLIYSS